MIPYADPRLPRPLVNGVKSTGVLYDPDVSLPEQEDRAADHAATGGALYTEMRHEALRKASELLSTAPYPHYAANRRHTLPECVSHPTTRTICSSLRIDLAWVWRQVHIPLSWIAALSKRGRRHRTDHRCVPSSSALSEPVAHSFLARTGRLMSKRRSGQKLVFYDIEGQGARVQIMAMSSKHQSHSEKLSPEEEFKFVHHDLLRRGDLVGTNPHTIH